MLYTETWSAETGTYLGTGPAYGTVHVGEESREGEGGRHHHRLAARVAFVPRLPVPLRSMARVDASPLLTLRRLFAVRGAFAPSSVHAERDVLQCSGVLATAVGARRRVILVLAAAARGLRGRFATGRASYGFGPARFADAGDAFEVEVAAAALPVLERLARREDRLAGLWPAAARACAAPPHVLDVPRSVMGRPVPVALVREAAGSPGPVLDIGLHLRAGCLQRCRFCRLERERSGAAEQDADLVTVRDLLRRVVRPARKRGLDVRFRLEADDLAGHRRLADVAALLAPHSASGLHLVVPPNRLAAPAAACRFAALPGLESVTLTLFGGTARTHDAMAGRKGAFRELFLAADNLHDSGIVPLNVNVVLTAAGVLELGGILDALRRLRGRPSISALFADCAAHHALLRAIAPDLASLRRAFSTVQDRLVAGRVRLQDFPVCALPLALRALNDSTRLRNRDDYPSVAACARCVHRPRCCGVPRGYLEAHGEGHLAPEAPARSG